MNQNQNIQKTNLTQLEKDDSHTPSTFSTSTEFTLDMMIGMVIGWLVYRASGSVEWAWIVGGLILLSSFCKQGFKHFYNQLIRPSYLKSSPIVKAVWKTVPVVGLSMIGSIRMFGVGSGLFVTSVVALVFTLILWLHESNLT